MEKLNLSQEKLQALRSEYKHRNVRGKYPRQKMLPEYRALYPWVLPDEVDPYFAFCTICECRLSAKRSDLGKHEGSIKHNENAAKKAMDGVVLKGCRQRTGSSMLASSEVGETGDNVKAETDEGTDDDTPYIKQEPIIDLIESSSIGIPHEELNQQTVDNMRLQYPEESDEDETDEQDSTESDDDVTYVPSSKRRCSETDSQSQHSSQLDFVPLQMTINESVSYPPQQSLSIREIPMAGSYAPPPPTTTFISSSTSTLSTNTTVTPIRQPTVQHTPANTPHQTPCKITIKKITRPMSTLMNTPGPTTATITPLPSTAHQQQLQQPRLQNSNVTNPVQLTPTPLPPRDSFELFFDSICASVKSLPPKLATEGKIRVMQLIGELEMRAITEREQEDAAKRGAAPLHGGGAVGGQQYSTVASTTK